LIVQWDWPLLSTDVVAFVNGTCICKHFVDAVVDANADAIYDIFADADVVTP